VQRAQLLQRFNHPNIATVYDIVATDDGPWRANLRPPPTFLVENHPSRPARLT
jgi:hypothetical protein